MICPLGKEKSGRFGKLMKVKECVNNCLYMKPKSKITGKCLKGGRRGY